MSAPNATTEDAAAAGRHSGRSIMAGGLSRLSGFLFGSLAGLVAIPIIARHLGDAEFGRYTAIISLITISTVLSDLGLSTLAVREFAARDGAERVARFRALLALRLVLAVITGVLMVLYTVAIGADGGVILGTAAAAVGVVALALHASWNAALQATMRLHRLAALESGRLFLIAAFGAIVALSGGSFGLLVAVYLPAGLIMAGASAVMARSVVPLLPRWDPKRMRSLFRAVLAFALAATVGSLYASLAQILVDRLVDDAQSSAFSLSFRLMVAALGAAMTAISGAFAPMSALARDPGPAFARLTRNVIGGALLLGALIAVTASALAGPLVDVFGGAQYQESVPILAVHAFSLPGAFVVYAGTLALLALHLHRQMLLIAAIGLTVTMALTTGIVLADGARGAAVASIASETIFALAILVTLARRSPGAVPSLSWSLRYLAALGAGAVVAHVGLPAIPAAVAAVAALLIVAVVLRLPPPEVTARLRGVLSGGRNGP